MCNKINSLHVSVVSYIEHQINYGQYLFCFKVSHAIEELASLGSSKWQHKELVSAHVERDDKQFLWNSDTIS